MYVCIHNVYALYIIHTGYIGNLVRKFTDTFINRLHLCKRRFANSFFMFFLSQKEHDYLLSFLLSQDTRIYMSCIKYQNYQKISELKNLQTFIYQEQSISIFSFFRDEFNKIEKR